VKGEFSRGVLSSGKTPFEARAFSFISYCGVK